MNSNYIRRKSQKKKIQRKKQEKIKKKQNKDTTEEIKQTIEYKNEQAKDLLFRKNMKESQSNNIIKQKKLLYETYIIKGHIIYYLNG